MVPTPSRSRRTRWTTRNAGASPKTNPRSWFANNGFWSDAYATVPFTGVVTSDTIAYAALAKSDTASTASISSYSVLRSADEGGVGGSSIAASVVRIGNGFAGRRDRVRAEGWLATARIW